MAGAVLVGVSADSGLAGCVGGGMHRPVPRSSRNPVRTWIPAAQGGLG